MSNVVTLDFSRRAGGGDAVAALAESFATRRRSGDDVFWLKENAEFLNILVAAGLDGASALDSYAGFYREVSRRMAFFPQYYRFLISITLDLEDLGVEGRVGEALIDFALDQGLAEAELSDLQRAEARRLFARRCRVYGDAGLTDRLLAFASRPATFAVPNKKAAYELTHIVFYLTEYGCRPQHLDDAVRRSLLNAGLLAFLDQNTDLLSEICLALRHGGWMAPEPWETAVLTHLAGFTAQSESGFGRMDDYHEYLVCNWLAASREQPVFTAAGGARGRITLHRPLAGRSALRDLSEWLLRHEGARLPDWESMRPRLARELAPDSLRLVETASHSTDHFPEFFAGFARAAAVAV